MSTQLKNDLTLRITVNEHAAELLEQQAKKHNIDLEKLIAERVQQFAHIDSAKPLVLQDDARRHLEGVLGRNLLTEDILVSSVTRAMQVQAGGVDIPLTPYLLDRLHTRCIGVPFEKFMQDTIKRLLEEFAGVR